MSEYIDGLKDSIREQIERAEQAEAQVAIAKEALEQIERITCLHLWWEDEPAMGTTVVAIQLDGPDDEVGRPVRVDQTFGNIARQALDHLNHRAQALPNPKTADAL